MSLINVGGILIDGVEIPIPRGEAARPQEIPVRGARRIVKMITLNVGGSMVDAPILWISPYSFEDDDLKKRCRLCVAMVAKGPPKPETVVLTVDLETLDNARETVIEW